MSGPIRRGSGNQRLYTQADLKKAVTEAEAKTTAKAAWLFAKKDIEIKALQNQIKGRSLKGRITYQTLPSAAKVPLPPISSSTETIPKPPLSPPPSPSTETVLPPISSSTEAESTPPLSPPPSPSTETALPPISSPTETESKPPPAPATGAVPQPPLSRPSSPPSATGATPEVPLSSSSEIPLDIKELYTLYKEQGPLLTEDLPFIGSYESFVSTASTCVQKHQPQVVQAKETHKGMHTNNKGLAQTASKLLRGYTLLLQAQASKAKGENFVVKTKTARDNKERSFIFHAEKDLNPISKGSYESGSIEDFEVSLLRYIDTETDKAADDTARLRRQAKELKGKMGGYANAVPAAKAALRDLHQSVEALNKQSTNLSDLDDIVRFRLTILDVSKKLNACKHQIKEYGELIDAKESILLQLPDQAGLTMGDQPVKQTATKGSSARADASTSVMDPIESVIRDDPIKFIIDNYLP